MLRYRALVEYDGTAYHGFQRQGPGQPTIQEALEQALRLVVGQPLTVTGAGRTDSGVHALGQVISFTVEWRHSVDALQRALNANLPADIVILQLEASSPTFHPRFDARRRAYAYRVYNASVRSPVRRLTSWYVSQRLNVAGMNEAAGMLVGVHDFATFGQPPQGENTIREVYRAEWQQQGEMLIFNIEANAFLYRMVRGIVGSLKQVGDGSWSVGEFVEAFRACDRSRCGTVAPPQGLFLLSVVYDE